jgi:hypothetical protein
MGGYAAYSFISSQAAANQERAARSVLRVRPVGISNYRPLQFEKEEHIEGLSFVLLNEAKREFSPLRKAIFAYGCR